MRNERKKSILFFLAWYGPVSLEALADAEDIPLDHARVYLWRYAKQGLILKNFGSFILSARGVERLGFLTGISPDLL